MTCHCRDCRNPSAENAGRRTLHTLRHREFEERVPTRIALRRLPPRRVRELVWAEFHVGACRDPLHAGQPLHSAVHQAVRT